MYYGSGVLISSLIIHRNYKEHQTDLVFLASCLPFACPAACRCVSLPKEPPVIAVYMSFTVTTERAGSETVTAPPESVAAVDETECELSVSQADASAGVNPLKETLADWAEPPEFVKTTTTELSVFLKAPIATLEMVPEVPTRTAPGLINRDHIASAQRRPLGIALAPSRTALAEEDISNSNREQIGSEKQRAKHTLGNWTPGLG